jgi:hypothetical protein
MSLEELEDYKRELEGRLNEPYPYTPGMYLKESEVVSTETVICRRISGEVHTALVLVHKDETRKVKCRGDCSDCIYGDVE